MMLANATGCSSIWGAGSPSITYSPKSNGESPARANSLLKIMPSTDTGYPGVKQIRKGGLHLPKALDSVNEDVKAVLNHWWRTLMVNYLLVL